MRSDSKDVQLPLSLGSGPQRVYFGRTSTSLDYPLAQLMLNEQARTVLEKHLPESVFGIPFRAFTLSYLIEKGRVDQKYRAETPQINSALKGIAVE